jgi:hypothetical protein
MMRRHVDEWIVAVVDVTPLAKAVHRAIRTGTELPRVPTEAEYPLEPRLER